MGNTLSICCGDDTNTTYILARTGVWTFVGRMFCSFQYVLHIVKACYPVLNFLCAVAYPGILFGGGGIQQIQFRTEDTENGDLGAVAS